MKRFVILFLLFCSCSSVKETRHYNSKVDDCDSTNFNCVDVRKWR